MVPEPVVPRDRCFDALYGLELLACTEDEARGRVDVHDGVRQPMGLVHGGVYAALAESLASAATADAVAGDGMGTRGLSTQTSFLRPILHGTINAHARRRHRGRTTWVWDVDVTDADGRLCAIVRATVAVGPLKTAGE
jgi:1,4-dihydroxy-2-naphthoyl-CoA hydrolase